MPSQALRDWLDQRARSLDEIEHAHRRVGGPARGRRRRTQQLNHAYVLLLSSQFQGFCRELHDECVGFLVQSIAPVEIQEAVRSMLMENRRLDSGNPNPGNVGSDFNRFGLKFWDAVYLLDVRNRDRRGELEELNVMRNAIAHHDPRILAARRLRLRKVKEWRRVSDNLATCFDEVIRAHLESVTSVSPW
jgi:hypothetical protein